ncbi:MAG: CpaD family pilus assembly protein [Pseudomonadota bacterium]|nr:CpaD family pilus assembly protein [Pseudomonadota bacterium]
MAQTKTVAVTLALGIALAASAPALAQGRLGRNPTVNSVHQPVVQRTDYVIDLAAGNDVPDSELYRLANWFDTLQLRYGDRIFVDGGYGSERARQQIAGVAAEYGLLLSEGTPVTAGGVQPGMVRVVVSRQVASVPGCPNWQEAGDIGMRITTGTNYGCAVNSNLAAMIANPEDLVLGQVGVGSGDAATASKAIKQYRTMPPTGAQGLKETVTKGSK